MVPLFLVVLASLVSMLGNVDVITAEGSGAGSVALTSTTIKHRKYNKYLERYLSKYSIL